MLWLVSKSQTVLWLAGEPLKDNFQLCTQTDGQVNLIACWTATFAVKNTNQNFTQTSSPDESHCWHSNS